MSESSLGRPIGAAKSAVPQTSEASTRVRDFANVYGPTSATFPRISARDDVTTTTKKVHAGKSDKEEETETLEEKFLAMTQGHSEIAVHDLLNFMQPSEPVMREGFFNDMQVKNLTRIFQELTAQPVLKDQHEVTILLPESIFKGLTVKIVIDKTGSVSAEFVSVEPSVRRQLDLQMSDLTDLMRSRGLSIQSLKTSTGSDSPGHSGTQEHHHSANRIVIEEKQGSVKSRRGDPSDYSGEDLIPDPLWVYRA